ncbi:MAG: hypothetical protein GX221_06480 [Candidatus Riflebacteria bacterium]|nr:hypothetical protein [Candidatus Riflebacteria bacterium]
MKRNRKSEKLFFTLIGAVVFCFSLFPVLAKDDAKYKLLPESSDSIPEAIIWSPYFQKTEQLNRFNLKVRLFQSSRLLMGVPQPSSRLWLCYRMQKLVSEKITSASQEIISSGIKWLDNDILFGDGSALAQKLELENRLTGVSLKSVAIKL